MTLRREATACPGSESEAPPTAVARIDGREMRVPDRGPLRVTVSLPVRVTLIPVGCDDLHPMPVGFTMPLRRPREP